MELKVPFVRPDHLATDDSSSYEVIEHALEYFRKVGRHFSYIVLLQPTSPFRRAEDVQNAYQLMESDVDMVVSVKLSKANPYFNLFEEDSNGYLSPSKASEYTRRQDAPPVYEYNGSIYVIRVASLLEIGSLRLPRVRKYVMDEKYSLDIDTPLDWEIAELLLDANKKDT